MEIVVDASAIIAVITDEAGKAAILQATKGAELLSPASCPWEVGNAFSAMLRRKRITLENARRAWEIFGKIPLRLMDVDMVACLELSNRMGIYAYDAYVLACAIERGCPLLTLDREMLRAAHALGVEAVEIAP